MTISKNEFLTLDEMKINAEYILTYLLNEGWTKNSICGSLGNMQTESTINPGIWQNLDEGNESLGYGLVQWTPSTKYTNWCQDLGLVPGDMNSNLLRIIYEVENGLQWIATSDYPLSFQEFIVSTESPEYLAQAFLKNYERPADQDQPNRSTQARYWWDTLEGTGTIDPTAPIPGEKKDHAIYHLWLGGVLQW
jgi:hypothetical protein